MESGNSDVINRVEARCIARELVPPADASWNKIALFGAKGIVENGTPAAAREAAHYALRHGLPDAEKALALAEYLESS